MQKFFLLIFLSATTISGRPQSIADLTEQLALDVQKLASIKSTLNDMVQGYDRLKIGYSHIRDIAKDNFNLHQSFIDALWILSPAVRADPRLPAVLNTTTRLVQSWRAATQLGNGPLFTAGERSTILATLDALLQRCGQAVEELTMITTDSALSMSDAQRLQAVDRIAAAVDADAAFLQQFNNELAIEAARRKREANDITILKALYGLPD